MKKAESLAPLKWPPDGPTSLPRAAFGTADTTAAVLLAGQTERVPASSTDSSFSPTSVTRRDLPS
jgi:hypothetical protein